MRTHFILPKSLKYGLFVATSALFLLFVFNIPATIGRLSVRPLSIGRHVRPSVRPTHRVTADGGEREREREEGDAALSLTLARWNFHVVRCVSMQGWLLLASTVPF